MRQIGSRTWGLMVLSAFLQVVIFPIGGPTPLWRTLFVWVAMAPMLMALLPKKQLSIRDGAIAGYLCGFLWYTGNCYWVYSVMHLYGGMSAPMAMLVTGLFSLYLGLYHALFAALFVGLARKCGNCIALGASPFLWVAVELARARITGFPWDQLGIAKIDNSLLTQLAPVGGVYLVSFVLFGVNALITSGVLMTRRSFRIALLSFAASVVLVFEVGAALHLGQPAMALGKNKAVLLQPNLSVGSQAERLHPEDVLGTAQRLSLNPTQASSVFVMPEDIARRDVTLWPESPAPYLLNDSVLRQQLFALSVQTHAPLIAGSVGVEETLHGRRYFNSAAWIDPADGYVGRYDKIHLVPFGEYVPYAELFSFASGLTAEVGNSTPGTSRQTFHSGGHAYGVFICYESIFGDEVRRFVQNGAEVLANISDDEWYGDTSAPFEHLAMARMRAIENRRWLLRDTNSGVTASIDPWGRIVETTARHTTTAIAVHFEYLHDETFYTRHGDLFAYLCVVLGAAAFFLRK